jgi:outer membrane lipoprotein-sorting protein
MFSLSTFVRSMVALSAIALAAAANAAEPDADALLRAANASIHFDDSTTQMQMRVLRDGQLEAEYEMNVHKLDTQRTRIEFTQPAREKGRRLLRVGDKMWMFLPDLGKPIVMSARQGLLGSSLANGDLLRVDLVADYAPTSVREEAIGDVAAQVLELKARSPESAYDRILLWVEKASQRPLRQEFYTVSGKRLRTINYGKPATFGGIAVNSEIDVESTLMPRDRTVLTITGLAVRQKLPAGMFQKDSIDR